MKTKRAKKSSPALKIAPKPKALPLEKLRWQCPPASLKASSTDDVRITHNIIGQDRAVEALTVGLEMQHKGFNIFATGLPGTGRMTTIKRMIQQMVQSQEPNLRDHCYVHNFLDPDQPKALSLPAGQGRALREDMDNFIQNMLRDIPAVYESSRYQDARKKVMQHFQDRQKSVLGEFERRVKAQGFELVQVQVGNVIRPDIVPVVNEQPVNMEQIDQMAAKEEITREQFEQIRSTQAALEKQMGAVFRQLRNIERKVLESMRELDERLVMPVVDDDVKILKTTYDSAEVHAYLDQVRESISLSLDRFRKTALAVPSAEAAEEQEADEFVEYQVNVLVDNSRQEHAPIVIETNPKYKNMFGTIEREFEKGGAWTSDFTLIKPGSLLHADGGYYVLNARDALVEPWVWQDLKRTLRTGTVEMHSYDMAGGVTPIGMKPQPIDLRVKVIMVGDTEIYDILSSYDEDFKKIFKIRADFDYEMPKTTSSVSQYLSFVKKIAEEEHLLRFDAKALAKLVEYGVRLSGSQGKLSTRFNILADIVREANYWALKERQQAVSAQHINRAIDARTVRVSLVEEKIHELLTNGTILIDTKGSRVGQLNGLSVYDNGEHAFGRPSRITAKTSLGRSGIINIEREAELSGPFHNKGVAIITGFLRNRFAQNKPLVMDASLTFEQSYGGVDGDSASSTEIYAILSSLSGIPLRQDIAVTGSVNQNGEIQPIGGVNLKIEGFYEVCKSRGLTGTQGVMIPKQNVKDLMLKEEIVEAVKKKKFAIYSIGSIDEGVELLTGVKAGTLRKDGTFEPETVNAIADRQLQQYAEHWKKFEGGKS